MLAGESSGEHAAASPAPMGVCGAGASQAGCKGCKPRIETPAGYEGDVFFVNVCEGGGWDCFVKVWSILLIWHTVYSFKLAVVCGSTI